MIRLYYTNPLIAAYMTTEFGVAFVSENNEILWFSLIGGWYKKTEVADVPFRDNFYVHSDYCCIFNPQQQDIVLDWRGEPRIVGKVSSDKIYWMTQEMKIDGCDTQGSEILQRNGKRFFVPKKEEDGAIV